jgi:hypothetical protein
MADGTGRITGTGDGIRTVTGAGDIAGIITGTPGIPAGTFGDNLLQK